MIMRQRRMIYDVAIILLGTLQAAPCLLIFGSTIIALVLGMSYTLALACVWRSTIIGRWYFRELWRATLRLENAMFPTLG